MDRAEDMNKNFRHAVFLSLFLQFDEKLYHKTYKTIYETSSSPMLQLGEKIGHDVMDRASDYADELNASLPKVVE